MSNGPGTSAHSSYLLAHILRPILRLLKTFQIGDSRTPRTTLAMPMTATWPVAQRDGCMFENTKLDNILFR